ncbi:DNA helicase RecG [Candidatus Falkowbacteria bacterium CG10_big_fil_rev_8_21_14_0_10_39_11]|uniref:ATP-dependent DNA helicase RecG n=1 Tax=Candidatus Falkowbacteria bacterium CG10_big_fil_rev_8_21_14_0_10_39_11 TaxID=1974565 RepID=A0A2H0V615_9BACT|nr:MAG: DNA helicase RecG [Candidatus Falkowbacteria bacterium CG10_big_fil_rev_8_21_14_0_10_39_11]
MSMKLSSKIELLPRLGKTTAKRLQYLGIQTIEDLVWYFPFRYEDFSQIRPIRDVQDGDMVTIHGQIEIIASRRSRRQRKVLVEAIINDNSGQMKVVWFNQPYIAKTLKQGEYVYFSGKVEVNNYGTQLLNPDYEKEKAHQDNVHTARIVPVYSLTAGLTEKQLRYFISLAVPLIKNIEENLPPEIISTAKIMSLSDALLNIHFPKDYETLKLAKQRLSFQEMFIVQYLIKKARADLQNNNSIAMKFLEKPTKEFVDRLPFKLTNDQKKAAWEIIQGIGQEKPMNRLLEGDVGSGKTIVVALSMLNVARNGYVAIMMAPTEILAVQHYKNFVKLYQKEKLSIGLLTRSRKEINGEKVTAKKLQEAIDNQEMQIIVGTQALIQDKVKLKDLGLVIIDEQHRFGVKQRKTLIDKEQNLIPHFLSMTATPIPRSLALALYGDLELSIIKELPANRKPIISRLVEEINRDKAYQFTREQITVGRQAFVICPLIDPSDKLGVKSVTEVYERLSKDVFPDLRVKMLHGKLKADEKNQIMQDFYDKKYDILVSTSVIEVGIDVPNATIMMIEGADRFGLAQLHQFRGRVGRGEHQSYCLIFTDNTSQKTLERLKFFVSTKDGFALAEKDLQLRGAGDVYGVKQSGLPDLKLADLSDINLIKKVQDAAGLFIEKYKLKDYSALERMVEKQEITLHFE